jgi:hypothetical protein
MTLNVTCDIKNWKYDDKEKWIAHDCGRAAG